MPRKATTRNAQGAGNIRKRPDGRWEARYVAGHDPGTGKQIRKSVYGKTQAEVRKKLQQATTAIDEGTYVELSEMTVGAWLDAWLEVYTGNIKPTTRTSYTTIVNYHLKPSMGAIKLKVLKTHDIQTFYNRLFEGTDDEEGRSAKTIKNIHGVLHKALQQAVELSYIKVNPTTACKLPRGEKPEIMPLVDDKLEQFMKAIQGHPFELVYVLDIFTGLRKGEILGLTWDCFSFEDLNIYLYRQLQRQPKVGFVFAPLKNDEPRNVILPPTMVTELKQHKRRQAQMRLMAGEAWVPWNNANLVFTNELGRYLNDVTVYKNFKQVVKGMNMPNVCLHDLRHSYAVASMQAGIDIKTIQANLGHYSAAFTLDTYGHVTDRLRLDAAKRLDDLYNSCKGSK